MKVICIDQLEYGNSPFEPPPQIGNFYTVIAAEQDPCDEAVMYELKEFPPMRTKKCWYRFFFDSRAFALLSNIDERELATVREKELA